MPTPTAAERLHALQQKNRKAAGLPDPSEYKKKLDSMKKENYEEDDGPLSQEQLDEISSQLKASYVSGAKKQIKQSLPFTKKTDEYRDIAKNFIAKRQKGIAKANEEVELDENEDNVNARKMYHKHFVASMKSMASSPKQKHHQAEMAKYKAMMGDSFINQVAPSKFAKFDKKIKEEVEQLDEMPESNMKTKDVHSHLKKAGWELARSKGGHDVYKHPKAKHSIPVPRHNQLKAPLIRGIMKASKVEEGVTLGRLVGRGNIYQYDRNPGPRDGSELEHVPFHAKTEKQKKLQNALNDLGKKMKETHPKLREAKDSQEYDYEGDMAKSDLRSIMHHAKELHDMLDDDTNLAEWCQSKITLAEDYLSTVANYMRSEMNEGFGPNPSPNKTIVTVNGHNADTHNPDGTKKEIKGRDVNGKPIYHSNSGLSFRKFATKADGTQGVELHVGTNVPKSQPHPNSPNGAYARKYNEEVELDEMVVVKTNKPIGTRVADIGPGGKEYNVKTDKAWDDSKKKQPQGADFAAQRRKERLAKNGRMDEEQHSVLYKMKKDDKKIAVAHYKLKDDAHKFLSSVKTKGGNGIVRSKTNEEVELDEKKNLPGLWANIHAKRKRGESPAKPGDKDYPKTLNIESHDTPFNKPYNKDSGTTTDKSGAKHTPMSKARHLARQALSKTVSKKADTKQQARSAFDGMFGGGNPTNKLSIMKKESAAESVKEGVATNRPQPNLPSMSSDQAVANAQNAVQREKKRLDLLKAKDKTSNYETQQRQKTTPIVNNNGSLTMKKESASEPTEGEMKGKQGYSRKAQIVMNAAGKGKKSDNPDKFQKDPELSSEIHKT